MGECVSDRDTKGVPSIFKVIRSVSVLGSMFPILDLICEENVTWVSYNERLKTKGEGSTLLAHTGLLGGLEHLKM